MSLVAELKPDVLSQDATAGELRIWVTKFEAYYHTSNMQVARILEELPGQRSCPAVGFNSATDYADTRGWGHVHFHIDRHFQKEISSPFTKKAVLQHDSAAGAG